MTHLVIENRDGHWYCHRTKFVVYDGVIQEKNTRRTNDLDRSEINKKIVFSKRTKNKLEKMFFFTVNEHFFRTNFKNDSFLIERTIL